MQPRRYSSGKTQLDLIGEILEAFESTDLVFLRGMVGSGKSVVGIRSILELGRGVVSVPTKVLSDQYAESYEGDRYFLKEDRSRTKIGILKGRGNFPCPFMKKLGHDVACDNRTIPCRRPLDRAAKERRLDALTEDPHWGFIFPSEIAKNIKDVKKSTYEGIAGEWSLCQRGDCPYWKQFEAYVDCDVIVMNSVKWAAEAAIGRLPRVPLTVIDEADEWLDALAIKVPVTQKRVDWLKQKLQDRDLAGGLDEVWGETLVGAKNPLDLVIYLTMLLEEIDETFGDFFWNLKSVTEQWENVEVEVKGDSVLYLVPDPQPVLKKTMERVGGKWLLMSATVQSEEVLKEIFGIDPVFVEGETRFPGKLVQRKLGWEEPVNYSKWRDEGFRREYMSFLSEILRKAKRPAFLPVHAFKYLPPEIAEKVRRSKGDAYDSDGVLISTKMDRGTDLKEMGSIVITKFPFPEREDPLLKGMEKRLGEKAFWIYYRDMAERCFVQQIGRVLRLENDTAEFWSPDDTCHRLLFRLWKGNIEGMNR